MKTIPVIPGGGASWSGWVKPLSAYVEQLEAEIAGLEARLDNPISGGVPTAYMGQKIFSPESYAFNLDTEQDGVSSNPVNYVVRDGATYDISVRMPGPGVFVARSLHVGIFMRQFRPGFGVRQLYWTPNQLMFKSWTTKFSVFPKQPLLQGTTLSALGTSFFWSLLDSKSSRKLSDELISSEMLLVRESRLPGTSFRQYVAPDNGGIFTLDVPWVFERDGQANFQFRPVTPIVQFDSSLSGTSPAVGLTYDDRENGVRNQSVTVQVELHGYRFLTDQDAMRAGALTRQA
jgi:hypothetical protein